MTITINRRGPAIADNLVATTSNQKKMQRGHVLPRRPLIDLDQPGRLRTGEVMALEGISHSGLYAKMKKGLFPLPDGNDGRNYWNTSTIRTRYNGGAK